MFFPLGKVSMGFQDNTLFCTEFCIIKPDCDKNMLATGATIQLQTMRQFQQ